MGAWDFGPFDNDGALDALGRLRNAESASFAVALGDEMNEVVECEDYLESYEAQGAIAVAVLVAVRSGAEVTDRNAVAFLAEHPFEATRELRDRAAKTFDRVTTEGDNEWFELWAEGDSIATVVEALNPFRAAVA